MIYAGCINFGSPSTKEQDLTHAVGFFSQSTPAVLHKGPLTLCYGKLSDIQDVDDVWVNSSSILLGRVFDKENGRALRKDVFNKQALLSAESVLKDVWGKYVYINIAKERCEIIVDSTGQLPFFYYQLSDGCIAFASDMEILFKVLGKKPDYNWEYLCSYLVYSNSSAIQTPFKDVFEIPPGCRLYLSKHEKETIPFWNPLESYKKEDIRSQSAVDVLKKTLNPWIEPFQTVCVSLSGGLDSSSLVYCLKDLVTEGQTLKALNYFHSQVKSSNELVYARQVCKETGIELIELDASDSLPFDPWLETQPLKPNKPFTGLLSLKWSEATQHYHPQGESSIFISGHGSDHIFMRPPSKRSTADYLLEKGLKGYKKQLTNIAQFYRDPLYSIFKENTTSFWSYALSLRNQKRGLKNTIDETPDWAKQTLREVISHDFVHPIYGQLPKKILPGKYDQIDAIYEGIASIHVPVESQANPTYYPFLCSPVVEFSLSFPTYELFDKGYDRYPLRKAVSDLYKTDTVWRRDKSQTTGLFQLGVKRNLDYVLNLCLEGHFVKQGFIDREGLYKTITLIGNGDINHLWPFMHLASTEIFLRYWDGRDI